MNTFNPYTRDPSSLLARAAHEMRQCRAHLRDAIRELYRCNGTSRAIVRWSVREHVQHVRRADAAFEAARQAEIAALHAASHDGGPMRVAGGMA